MNAIVSVCADWAIGKDGGLLVRNPVDMRFFRDATLGGTVICGRLTFESFPGGALKGRRNVVLTTSPTFCATGAEVARDVESALALVADANPDEVWAIGGESVYRSLLPYCKRAYVTKNDTVCPADTFFPNLDADDAWRLVESREGGVTPDGVPFSFCVYERCDR